MIALIEEMERIESNKSRSAMERPTLEQVKLVMAKAGLPESEADGFISYYESNGWKVGRIPMKSWEHAIGTWAKNWRDRQTGQGVNPTVLFIAAQKELETVVKQIDNILRQDYRTDEDNERLKKLKDRRKELKEKLGVKF